MEKQIYIMFSSSDNKAPKEKDGPAAQQLHTKLNTLIKPPASDASVAAVSSIPTIWTLRFTKCSTILLEFNSAAAAENFQAMTSEQHIVTTHVCRTASILPWSYWVILCFIPCTGGFDPCDPDHLTQIEEVMNLPPPLHYFSLLDQEA